MVKLKTLPLTTWRGNRRTFRGGCGYSLRHSNLEVHLAESDEHLRELWNWLTKESSSSDILEIPLNLTPGQSIKDLPLSYGQMLLLKNWQRTNNVGNCWTVSPWGNSPGFWVDAIRTRVSQDINLIRHWQVYSDGFELMESDLKNDSSVTWFIDPVYQYNYKYRIKTQFDYGRLSNLVKELKGQVIVCEATCPKTGVVPEYLEFTPFRKTVTSRRKPGNNMYSNELIYHRLPD